MAEDYITSEVKGVPTVFSMNEAVMLRNDLTRQIMEIQEPVARAVNFLVPTRELLEIDRLRELVKSMEERNLNPQPVT